MSTAAPPQMNGRTHPMPDLGDRRPVEQDTPIEPPTPTVDHVALAEAAAIRERAAAETEARRVKAAAEADALRAKAAVDAEKQRISNERAAMALEEKRAAHATKMAEEARKREDEERKAREAREAEEAERRTAKLADDEIAKADAKWRTYAIVFAVACGIVALPVQISAFWNPQAWWLVAAPVVLEGGSWVVQRGAAAAVANRRPLWHYRTIAWLLAFIAAGINLWHGWHAFDPATAIATAFASVAGPGVWDLHEHGRIRKRDGALSRRERKTKERDEARAEAMRQLEEKAKRFEREAAEKAAAEAAQKLAADRESRFPKVWEHALMLAADLGETTVTDAIWKRAKRNVEGADPGESADILRMRNAAEARVEAARTKKSVSAVGKTKNEQRAIQINKPRIRSSYKPVPPVRKPGDTPSYHRAARAAHGETKRRNNAAKNATTEESK